MATAPRPGGPVADTGSMETLWVGTCRSRWALPIVVAALALAPIPMATGDPLLAVVAVLISVVVAPFRSVEVTINRQSLRVDFAGPYWRSVVLPMDEIRHRSVVVVNPLRHGGWGYRGSLRVFHRLAVVLRRGPGIRVDLENGGWVVVTVDDAETAVTVLQTVASS